MWNRYKVLVISFFLTLTMLLESFCGAEGYSIVFIHIGPTLPRYTETALLQARAFNPDCPIILVANECAFAHFAWKEDFKLNVTQVSCESLKKTLDHQRFIKDSKCTDPFWRYTSERFLYLNDLIAQYKLENVFHLENDNMLYVNLEELLPVFKSQYPGMAATFDNDERCIPGFVYISSSYSVNSLAKCFADHAKKGLNDMQILSIFKNTNKRGLIANLPIIMEEYIDKNLLISPMGHLAKNKHDYCNNIDVFQSIFDAAALGQYLGGINPANGDSSPGFINERCLFNPSLLTYEWLVDEQGRKVPYAIFDGKKYRINSLHIHSKNLEAFFSK